jgi:multicomponent Na+:H+ antiporter subunit D
MNPGLLITLPILIPLAGGVIAALGRRNVRLQRGGLVGAMALNLLAGVLLFAHIHQADGPVSAIFGGWVEPIGIGFYVDLLAAIMVLVAAVIAFCGAWYATGEIGQTIWRRHYAFFFCMLIAGINGAFLTGDLFNLFVWFEVMLMASFALMILGRRRRTYEGATKYVVINMVSSFLFLSALGILYGTTGTLNLVDLGQRLATHESDPLILTSAALLMGAFGIKAGLFPLYFWLPASYPHTGFATSAVFGGLLTKVGVYALFRVFGGTLGMFSDLTGPFLLVIGALTMVMGVLGAASQFHTRRILSFHIISQIGYLVLGLGLFTQGAIAAAIFYNVHNILAKSNLFLAAGLIANTGRSERLEGLGGLFRAQPMLAVLFAIPALSLSGIPPLSGFFAKFLLIREAFRAEAWIWATIALAVSMLTLVSMSKVWSEAFWKDSPRPAGPQRVSRPGRMAPMAFMAVLTILIGLFAGPLWRVADRASEQLIQQQAKPPIVEAQTP